MAAACQNQNPRRDPRLVGRQRVNGLLALCVTVELFWPVARAADPPPAETGRSIKPALSVQLVSAQPADWPAVLTASGALAAWQEAVVSAELSGLRLATVGVDVGDVVRRGQVLATLAAESVQADLDNARAALVEAEALFQEARGNADRARALAEQKAMSAQEVQRNLTAEQTAQARVKALSAQLAAQALRWRQTRIVAQDDGIISSRQATLGAVVPAGQELFRLIRKGRLEWRAELPSADLARIRPGMAATLTPPGDQPVQGRVRTVAPTVEPSTRNGLVYVDLPASASRAGARAGMFASGQFALGTSRCLTLPQSAVLLRDGFSYVFKVDARGLVSRSKVGVGRRVGDRIEIREGLDAQARVVASGVGFLSDGDTVRVLSRGSPPAVAAPIIRKDPS